MNQELLVERFLETLINGDRVAARAVIRETTDAGIGAPTLINNLFFPAYEKIEQLHRADQITKVAYHLASRLLRMLVDQTTARLTAAAPNGKTVFAVCGPSESEELAAQMVVDLLEAGGCQVTFTGGGIPGDEILAQVHERRPDILLMFASAASDLPEIRAVIDQIREIGAVDRTKIVVGGGVFNRAEGLAEELHADLWAMTPLELVEVVLTGKMKREPIPATVGRIGKKTIGARQRAAA
ncbi:MAG: cobalamin-dependent protein [Phycisphaerae bacterium]|nr:cobalamin-dependent protein [Phycisphaerae bacterium]